MSAPNRSAGQRPSAGPTAQPQPVVDDAEPQSQLDPVA
jgi:hypothetical protein